MLLITQGYGGAPPTAETFEAAFYARLIGTTAVTGLVGGRIHPGHLPDTIDLAIGPALVYRIISKPHDATLDAGAGSARARVQVSAFSRSYGRARQVIAAIRAALPIGFRGILAGTIEVLGTTHTNERDLYEPSPDGSDAGTHHVTCDLRFRYRESA